MALISNACYNLNNKTIGQELAQNLTKFQSSNGSIEKSATSTLGS